jgi:hypothetical protein
VHLNIQCNLSKKNILGTRFCLRNRQVFGYTKQINSLLINILLICITKDIYFYHLHRNLGSSWSWSYGSWIYNYLCNHYHHKSCEFDSCSWWGVLDTTLCDKVCQWLAAGLGFSTFINKNWPPRYEWNIVFVCLWLVSVFYRFENLWFTVI